jgi:beta-lactamase superfamily II metal-dependent hydrolase
MTKSSSDYILVTIRITSILLLMTAFIPVPALAVGACGSGTWSAGNLEIHHINIGQGDSTLIVGPTGKSLLFDAGEANWNSSAKAQIIGPYIEGVLGCKSIDYVAISHFHLDHAGYVGYGGLWNLVEVQGFSVGKTLVRDYNTYLGDTSGTFDNWKTYLAGSGNAQLNPVTVTDGTDQVDLGSGVAFRIVAHDGNGAIYAGNFSGDASPPSENDYSIGAVLSYGAFDEWIGGDLDGMYEVGGFGYTYHDIELSAAREVGDVDVYKVNHHASSHSSSQTFVNQLDPEVSIVTVGNGNTYGHPDQSIMNRLLSTSTVYMTERGNTNTNIGSAIVAGHIVIKTSNGTTYTVNGTAYTATEPIRIDADNDGYFAEVDPADNNSATIPSSNGGCNSTYQNCSVACSIVQGQILINEVLPSPSSGPEWVELYNTTNTDIDIGYCYIDDIPSGSPAYRIPSNTIIAAHGFWTLDRDNYFNNTGDYVRFLKSDAATELDSYGFGQTGHDLSWYRETDGGVWSPTATDAPTKGISNSPQTFADVPLDHPLYKYIKALWDNGYTAGCSTNPLMFCPDQILDRAQSAVFMLRGQFGAAYTPPPAPWDSFNDDWTGFEWAQPWAEGMWQEGLTAGCQANPLMYCPRTQLPRVEASVFGLRMRYGVNYTPPPASGMLLGDMTDLSYWGTSWAEKAYMDGLLPACGTDVNGKPLFCPSQLVNRGWGAYLIVKAKNIPVP